MTYSSYEKFDYKKSAWFSSAFLVPHFIFFPCFISSYTKMGFHYVWNGFFRAFHFLYSQIKKKSKKRQQNSSSSVVVEVSWCGESIFFVFDIMAITEKFIKLSLRYSWFLLKFFKKKIIQNNSNFSLNPLVTSFLHHKMIKF